MFSSAAVYPTTAVDAGHAHAPEDRFRKLLGDQNWQTLPTEVQRRFSKRVSSGQTVVYSGVVTRSELSPVGSALANVLRLIGAPLPLSRTSGVPTVVAVTAESDGDGQTWTRAYGRSRGFPQVIQSTKRFSGPSGLEEFIGFGISMGLRLCVDNGVLIFQSTDYAVTIFGVRISLPAWIGPGSTTVAHEAIGAGAFNFSLKIIHPLFGRLIWQEARYRDETI